jgi:hypothetical protein
MKKQAKPAAKNSANKKPVLINFILDKSGSMGSILTDTIGGFNTYIQQLQLDEESAYKFSLTLFNTGFENRHVAVDMKNVPELTQRTYLPSGGTALYDAIGATVAKVENESPDVEKVLTVILTDGQENSSREYRRETIKALIERKEKEGNWTFVFLGAGLDSFAVGDSIGVSAQNAVQYDTGNITAMFRNTARASIAFSASRHRQVDNLYQTVPAPAMSAAGMSVRPQKESPLPGGHVQNAGEGPQDVDPAATASSSL